MIVSYSWPLNKDLIYKNINAENVLDCMQKYELPAVAQEKINVETIEEKYPAFQQLEHAQRESLIGIKFRKNGKIFEAAIHFEKALTLLERFRSSSVISSVKSLYYGLASCYKPIKAISLIKAAFLIGGDSKGSPELFEYEKSKEKEEIEDLTEDYHKQGISGENCEELVVYLLFHPSPERINKAESLVKQCLDKDSKDYCAQLGLAKCYIAKGLFEPAFEIAEQIGNKNSIIKENLKNWRILLGMEIEPSDPLFGDDDYESLDMPGTVNRGFSLFVNAIYKLALRYFNLALKQSPSDPFALFGQALTLWKFRRFGLAKRQIDKAINSLEKYQEFRNLLFCRSDEYEPPKSYCYNPIYPIFNMKYCKGFIERLDPFVSYVIVP